ncbi:MAG: type I asparaginase [Vicingaceae bacterium]
MSETSKVLIIYTGGTIGMVEDPETGFLHAFDFDHLLEEIPELNKVGVGLEVSSLDKPIDSSNMGPAVWVELLEVIEKNYANFDGFVILHGSDTMAYTASALSFLLENVSKPIIFTGSQLPIGKIRTDGKENIITAIEIAGDYVNGSPVVPEVAIYFEYALYRANRTTKISAENFEAFQSPNYPLLAEAGVHIKYNRFAINKPQIAPLIARKKIVEDVASIRIFPGLQEKVFQAVAQIPNLKGLILETYGSGNAPSLPWLAEEIMKLNDKGVILVNITQCVTGKVIQAKYETGVHLERAGVISGEDMTFEAAITKLMYLLSCEELDLQQKKEFVGVNLRGELS